MELHESLRAARRAHAEQCVEFPGPAGQLRGIVTPADSGARRNNGWVILPGRPRFAFSRMPVIAARVLAAEGCSALRFDLQGTGESDGWAEVETRYKLHGENVAAAIRFLRRVRGAERFHLIGYCFDALCALDAFRLEAAAIESLFFAAAPVTEIKIEDSRFNRIARAAANPRQMLARLKSPSELAGRAAVLLRRTPPSAAAGRDRMEPKIEVAFRALVASRARALFVYGENEPLREEFRVAERMIADLNDDQRRRLVVEIWPEPVHSIESEPAIFARAVAWVRQCNHANARAEARLR
jgi:pimeloyl-ACP methyl ester carboxylesterase